MQGVTHLEDTRKHGLKNPSVYVSLSCYLRVSLEREQAKEFHDQLVKKVVLLQEFMTVGKQVGLDTHFHVYF